MKIEFKVYQRFAKEEIFKHIGFERINSQGNWEYKRNKRGSWTLGTISDNQGNAEFKRMQFTNKLCENQKVYDGDIFEFDINEWGGNDNIHFVSWNESQAGWSFGGGCSSDMEWRTLIGNIIENSELLS